MSFQPPKGTFDVVAGSPMKWRNAGMWRRVLAEWEPLVQAYGYSLVMTPVFEATELFERGVGGDSEVVTKQMYTFVDKGGRSITLRPEGTAGVMRAFLNSGGRGAWKGAYSGPMFRYERPQKGRYRQFWQLGVEYIDVEGSAADAEVIELGFRYLDRVGVPSLEVRLNSLGDHVCRPAYLEALTAFLSDRIDELCDDSRQALTSNPLRVLDCKECAAKLEDAPGMLDHLCADCRDHFDGVTSALDGLQIPYELDNRLVRGLDYYTRTAFEYIAPELDAAQNAVGGGGRYDGLAEILGGRRAPGVGFALGVDRVLIAIEEEDLPVLDAYLVSETSPAEALVAASRLRAAGLRVEFDAEGRSMKAQFRSASRSGSTVTILFRGPNLDVEVRTTEERVGMPLGEVANWIKGPAR